MFQADIHGVIQHVPASVTHVDEVLQCNEMVKINTDMTNYLLQS